MIIYYNGERVDTSIYCLAIVSDNKITFAKEANPNPESGRWEFEFDNKDIACLMWEYMRVSEIKALSIIDFDDELPKVINMLKEQERIKDTL